MKYFCMPADFRCETVDRYAELNASRTDARVCETYGNITVDNPFGSGRNTSDLPAVDLDALKRYVARSREHGIAFNYTLNAPYMGNAEFTPEGVARVKAFLRTLHETGVTGLSIALPGLMEITRSMDLGFAVRASVICNTNSANKAMELKRAGAERVVVDESINRDFRALRNIVQAFGDKVEIIANSVCQQDCSYRIFHYNQIAGDSAGATQAVSGAFYRHRCALRTHQDPSTLLKAAWIRPEDLHYYTETGIRYFKLQGRQTVQTGDPVRAVRAYMDGRYDGDLVDLLFLFSPTKQLRVVLDNRKLDGFLKPFFEDDRFCGKNCGAHGYCDRFAERVLAGTNAAEVLAAGRDFLLQNDPYRPLLEQ